MIARTLILNNFIEKVLLFIFYLKTKLKICWYLKERLSDHEHLSVIGGIYFLSLKLNDEPDSYIIVAHKMEE